MFFIPPNSTTRCCGDCKLLYLKWKKRMSKIGTIYCYAKFNSKNIHMPSYNVNWAHTIAIALSLIPRSYKINERTLLSATLDPRSESRYLNLMLCIIILNFLKMIIVLFFLVALNSKYIHRNRGRRWKTAPMKNGSQFYMSWNTYSIRSI